MLTPFSGAMQDEDPEDPLSYSQIAGIHGLPSVPWNGDEVSKFMCVCFGI